MKKILSLSLLTSSLLFSSSLESIGLNIGSLNSDYKQINHTGSITLGNTPDEKLNALEIFTTYKNKIYGMKPYLSYTYSSNKELKHQFILAGLNKYYSHDKLDLYAGVLAGYGELKYRYNPLNNSKDNNEDANSLIAGIQLGVTYPFNENISMGVNGKYLVHDYETKLAPSDAASSSLEHDKTTVLSIGINYSF